MVPARGHSVNWIQVRKKLSLAVEYSGQHTVLPCVYHSLPPPALAPGAASSWLCFMAATVIVHKLTSEHFHCNELGTER
jgi:hypothetical protein